MFFFSSRRRHTSCLSDWSSDVCSSDLEAAALGARLVVFPECVLTGYCFTSKAEAMPYAEPLPGPSTAASRSEERRVGQECSSRWSQAREATRGEERG